MRLVSSSTRVAVCALLFMSHALLLYALSYGQAEAVRWQQEDPSRQRAVVALPSDSFVAAATQRGERMQPLLLSLKVWWFSCFVFRSDTQPPVAVMARIEALHWCLPQPLAVRAGEVLRL